jgi:uncharacterized protein (TIRG00374 family)
MSSSGRRTATTIAGMGISAVALWIVLQSVDLAAVTAALGDADPAPIVAILGIVAVQLPLRAFRWSILIPVRPRIGVGRLVPPLLIGYLGNAVLPARLGEPMRAVIVSRRERVDLAESLGSVLVERVVDVATLAPVAFAASLVVGAPAWMQQGLGLASAVGAVVILLLITIGVEPVVRLIDRFGLSWWSRIREGVLRFAATLGGRSRRRALLAAAGISAVAWLLDATSFWLAGRAVGADVTYAGAALIAGVTVLGTAIPSAPGYVGTFELAAVATAGTIGVPVDQAFALAVVAHAATLVPVALGGAVSIVLIGADFGEVARTAEGGRHG